jgi:hypothetical protein
VSLTKEKFPRVDGKHVRFEANYDGYRIVNKSIVTGPGAMASELTTKWGMVAAEIDGEDSAGRSKARLQTPGELIERAFTVAQMFWDKARERGMLEDVPEPKETVEEEGA